MRVSIYGSGYVGLVTGACLAETGNNVLCVDVDEAKIAGLKEGKIPIYEPGLEDVILRNVEAGRLRFTTDYDEAVKHGLFQFIAVGTPPDEDGSADMRYVQSVARGIAERMEDYRIVVDKSTVPVGTGDWVSNIIREQNPDAGKFAVVSIMERDAFVETSRAHPVGNGNDPIQRPDRPTRCPPRAESRDPQSQHTASRQPTRGAPRLSG